MTCNPEKYEENVEGALNKMPFDIAHALMQLGYYTSWHTVLMRTKWIRKDKSPLFESFDAALDLYEQQVKQARETWTLLGGKWAQRHRGDQEGAELTKAVLEVAQSSAEHCGALRVNSRMAVKGKKELEKQRVEAEESYRRFKAAAAILSDLNGVWTRSLRDSAVKTLWKAAWHAANVVSEMLRKREEEQEAGEDEEGGVIGEDWKHEDDEYADEDDNDKTIDDKRFGNDYLGSSDDPIKDIGDMLNSVRGCFWEEKSWRGVRLPLTSLDTPAALAEIEAIAAVPGLFGAKGLNCVRVGLEDLAAAKDPLGEVAREALMKAHALELDVILELPPQSGKEYEAWVKVLAAAAAPSSCVRGIALPLTSANVAEVTCFASAVRTGGLTQDRCVILIPLPGGSAVDAEGQWTPGFKQLHESILNADLPGLLHDCNVLFETPPVWKSPENGGPTDLQTFLDATSRDLCFNFDNVAVASSLTLTVPPHARGWENESSESKAADASSPTDTWYAEYAQRLIAVAQGTTHGYFFDSWLMELDSGLKTHIEKGLVNFAADVQVMGPVGGTHKFSLIYLHGFTCDGYGYLNDSDMFYRPKTHKKGKSKKDKKKSNSRDEDGDDDDVVDDIEYEPWPGLKVILPSSPVRKITAHKGEEKPAWYDYLTDFDGEMEDDLCMEDLEEQTRRIHAIIDAEVALVGAQNVFFGGASQGCCTAVHVALTYPGDIGACIFTMGHPLSCTTVTPEWIARKVPVYNYIGDSDQTMPWEKWVKAAWHRLEDAGADVRTHLEPGCDHGECEHQWVRAFLKECLMPS